MDANLAIRESLIALDEAVKHPNAGQAYVEIAREKLRAIMELPLHVEDPAESVSCDRCDASADSIAEALKNRWVGIEYAPDGLSYNYLGTCPTCHDEEYNEYLRAEEERQRKITDHPF